MSTPTFKALSLAAPVFQALQEQGYSTPTPIQAQAIPPQLEGKDIMGCAQTGTGKTAAFALPILSHLAENPKGLKRKRSRVLVLTPTRELAVQVGESFRKYGKHLRIRHALVYGGVSQVPQARNLSKGVDILVATPGRLMDLMEQGIVDISKIEFLVLDEMDRMLDMGFIHDVRKIAEALPRHRQTSLFTATMPKEVQRLAEEFVHEPVKITIAPEKPVVDAIDQEVCFVRQENKLALLQAFLREQKVREGHHSTIIFCRTKFGTEKLGKKLNQHGFASEAIHGDKSQAARQKALRKFAEGKVPVLVATDVAARGIDVRSISLVVNFDLPEAADSYVHRIGRTARAEAKGNAVSFCTRKDVGLLAQIERYIGMKVNVNTQQPFHDADTADHSSHHSTRPRGRDKGGKQRRGGPKAAYRKRPQRSRRRQ